MEFTSLNTRWDSQAYGSVVWMLMALHTIHLVTDAYDSTVLTVLMFTGPLEGKRFVDVSENAMYWYFVVLSWLPIYAVIYWAPRY
jgi:heme/copper-type cytochrome/quinol oxidase subunit 3